MSWVSSLRNWAAQRMAVGPGTNSGTGAWLQDTANYLSGSSSAPHPSQTAAVEFAVGIIGRAFMAANVDVSGARLDPQTMSQLARESVLLGESVQLIDIDRASNSLRLQPIAASPIITGGVAPESWRYEIRLPRPNGENPLDIDQLPVRNVSYQGMVHVRY